MNANTLRTVVKLQKIARVCVGKIRDSEIRPTLYVGMHGKQKDNPNSGYPLLDNQVDLLMLI